MQASPSGLTYFDQKQSEERRSSRAKLNISTLFESRNYRNGRDSLEGGIRRAGGLVRMSLKGGKHPAEERDRVRLLACPHPARGCSKGHCRPPKASGVELGTQERYLFRRGVAALVVEKRLDGGDVKRLQLFQNFIQHAVHLGLAGPGFAHGVLADGAVDSRDRSDQLSTNEEVNRALIDENKVDMVAQRIGVFGSTCGGDALRKCALRTSASSPGRRPTRGENSAAFKVDGSMTDRAFHILGHSHIGIRQQAGGINSAHEHRGGRTGGSHDMRTGRERACRSPRAASCHRDDRTDTDPWTATSFISSEATCGNLAFGDVTGSAQKRRFLERFVLTSSDDDPATGVKAAEPSVPDLPEAGGRSRGASSVFMRGAGLV